NCSNQINFMPPVTELNDTTSALLAQHNDALNLQELIIRLLINLSAALVLVGLIYFSKSKKRSFFLNFILFNSLIFLLCILLSTATLMVGFAVGLFAIFSIMRFRPVTVPVREMAYFFAVLTLGVINALAHEGPYYMVLAVCN